MIFVQLSFSWHLKIQVSVSVCVHVSSVTEWSHESEDESPRIEEPEYHVMELTYYQILEWAMETQTVDFGLELCVSGHLQNKFQVLLSQVWIILGRSSWTKKFVSSFP